jgi:bifunctional DNase/RNase
MRPSQSIEVAIVRKLPIYWIIAFLHQVARSSEDSRQWTIPRRCLRSRVFAVRRARKVKNHR